jgi:hypothetical protein
MSEWVFDCYSMMLRRFMFANQLTAVWKQKVGLRQLWHFISPMLSRRSENHHFEDRCQVPAAIFEFFQIASEMWLLCVAFDLAVTMSNPFSSFQARSSPCVPPLIIICLID